MTIFGDGTQTRAFSYIDDVAPLMAAAIDTPGAWNQVFNVGADRPWALIDLAAHVADAMGVPARIVHLPARHEAHHAHSSHEKIARVFGPRASTPLEAGLHEMAAWVKRQGQRPSTAFQAIEIAKNLPPSWQGR
jgi:UDP-glucose 4-epimerase